TTLKNLLSYMLWTVPKHFPFIRRLRVRCVWLYGELSYPLPPLKHTVLSVLEDPQGTSAPSLEMFIVERLAAVALDQNELDRQAEDIFTRKNGAWFRVYTSLIE
ncbi:hypothetical protein, partial [Salmonella enterica]|uniref:hypothetical protein n=1 Tax=Salmonella enterica TaxID=28901 RepID=UPI001C6352F3